MKETREKTSVFSTPWFDLVSKSASADQRAKTEPYYAIETLDYVSVLALTKDARVILVRQYRPAVEEIVSELPSGHVEKNERPEDSARRELLEETGYRASGMQLLGSCWSDTGRMSNRIWYFFTDDVVWEGRPASDDPEIQTVLTDLRDFARDIRDGRFEHALNLPAVFLALLKNDRFKTEWMALK